MKTTIVLPVSRDMFLDRIFMALETLECEANNTNLFAYVDGDMNLFVKTRNLVEQSKFAQRLCVQRRRQEGRIKVYDLKRRRLRISAIHNEMRQYIQPADFILLTEDDTVLGALALKRLTRAYSERPYAGFVSGVEVGRHGVTHIGAWRVDDVYDPTKIESIDAQQTGVEEVDAAGLYCTLVRYSHYVKHDFKPFDRNDLGPDVEFGLELRQMGQKNYVDHSVRCEHRTPTESLTVANTPTMKVTFTKADRGWKQEVQR